MRSRAALGLILTVIACKHEPRQVQAAVGSDGPQGCEQLPFAATAPIAEASGAAWIASPGFAGTRSAPEGSVESIDRDGKPALIVVGDSGNKGAYIVIDPETGASLESGNLPLDHGSDDVEGLAVRDGKLYGLTSAGYVRVWERDGQGWKLVSGPYPISNDHRFICSIDDGNCAKNYEGIALAPGKATGPCVGFAASKEDGTLYCLADGPNGLQLDPANKIKVDRKNVVADVAYSPEGDLYAGNNMFGLASVYRIDNWQDPPNAKVVEIGELGMGFPEVVAARGDIVYRLSDTGGSPSMMAKFRCKPSPR